MIVKINTLYIDYIPTTCLFILDYDSACPITNQANVSAICRQFSISLLPSLSGIARYQKHISGLFSMTLSPLPYVIGPGVVKFPQLQMMLHFCSDYICDLCDLEERNTIANTQLSVLAFQKCNLYLFYNEHETGTYNLYISCSLAPMVAFSQLIRVCNHGKKPGIYLYV